MATLTLTETHNYATDSLSNITAFVFAELTASAYVAFRASQFNNTEISNSLHITDNNSKFKELSIDLHRSPQTTSFSAANWTFTNWNGAIVINGTSGADTITGSSENDSFRNINGADLLDGKGGNDHFFFNKPADLVSGVQISGGTGDDALWTTNSGTYDFSAVPMGGVETFVFGNSADITAVFDGPQFGQFHAVQAGGTSHLIVKGSFISLTEVDFRFWSTRHSIVLQGTNGSDLITGSDQSDLIFGGRAGDLLFGSDGDDVFLYNEQLDIAIGSTKDSINGGLGNDTLKVTANIDFTNASEIISIEKLQFAAPSAQAFVTLRADQFGNGLITTSLNVIGDGDGFRNGLIILVAPSTSFNGSLWTFTNWVANDLISISGSPNADSIIGTVQADTLNGFGGADVLDGRLGTDKMAGGADNDTYYVDNAGDQVTETANQGSDTVIARASYALQAGSEVEAMRTAGSATTDVIDLTGNEFANTLQGNAARNTLNGRGGTDVMYGFDGNDTYLVDSAADVVNEVAGKGTDVVIASVSYQLAAGTSVEILRTPGSATTTAINLTGNEIANIIQGNAGANKLNGAGGVDTMYGFAGNDTFLVDTAKDVVVEIANQGTDKVSASTSYTLAAGNSVEILTTFGTATTTVINLTGNELAQTIQGNAVANTLDGRGGADSMAGIGGNDTYLVDNAGDQVIEATGQGTDTVRASTSYTLGSNQSIESLQTFGTGTTNNINLNGNSLVNSIFGNAGVNIINGRDGSDKLAGFGGADIFRFDTALSTHNVDTVSDFSAQDKIQLQNSIFTGLAEGTLSANAFHIGAAAADAGDRIIYNDATGALSYDPDGTASGTLVQFAKLAPGLSDFITNTQFVVI